MTHVFYFRLSPQLLPQKSGRSFRKWRPTERMLAQSLKGTLGCLSRGCRGADLFLSPAAMGWAVSSDMAPVVMSCFVTGPKATQPTANEPKPPTILSCFILAIYSSNRKLISTDGTAAVQETGSQVDWLWSLLNKWAKNRFSSRMMDVRRKD